MNILFVCTGNTCRSVMAKGLLEKMQQNDKGIIITSAGTGAYQGLPPANDAAEVMKECGIDVSNHTSQPLTERLIKEAAIIFVMEGSHKDKVLKLVPEAENKVHLLTEFGRMQQEAGFVNPDIDDPIGRGIEKYREVLGAIKECVERVADNLNDRH